MPRPRSPTQGRSRLTNATAIRPEAGELLAEARGLNPHVPAYLSGGKRLPARLPDYVGRGDMSEAVDYAAGAKTQWETVPGAIAWLVA